MAILNVFLAALFTAAVLFLVTAGLQLVFGVQRIVNLTAGSVYAFGAYFGASAFEWFVGRGGSPTLLLPVLVLAGIAAGLIRVVIERILRLVYDRDEAFQLLMTFAFVLMFQDILRFIWGAQPRLLEDLPSVYGTLAIGKVSILGLQCHRNLYGVYHRDRSLVVYRADTLRAHYSRHRREQGNGRRAGGKYDQNHHAGLCVENGAWHARRSVSNTDDGRVPRDAGDTSHRGVRRRCNWRIREHARRSVRCSHRRFDARDRAVLLPEIEIMAIYLVVVIVLLVRPYGLFGKAVTP